MTDETIDTVTTETTAEQTPAPAAAPEDGAPAQADAGKAQPAATIADGAEDKPVTTPADFPEDWRERMAGGDEKLLARLKRFASPANVVKSWRELESKISSGEFKKQPGKDATAEQWAEWRKENGIPDKAEDYALDLGGFVPSEGDTRILDNFKQFAHANNMAPAQLNEITRWYFEQQEQALAGQIEADKAYRVEAEEELRAEFGVEFRSNINAARNFLHQTAGEELTNLLFGARLADGTLLGNNANALRWLVQVARDQMPGADLVPAGSPNVGKGVDDRIRDLEGMMRNEPDKYYRDGFDQELLKLYEAREKMKSRAA